MKNKKAQKSSFGHIQNGKYVHNAQENEQKEAILVIFRPYLDDFRKSAITIENIFHFFVDSPSYAGIYSYTLTPAMKCDVADTPNAVVKAVDLVRELAWS